MWGARITRISKIAKSASGALWVPGVCLFLAAFTIPAAANHPTRDQMEAVRSLAHQLEADTGDLYNIALDERHHGTRWEDRAIGRLADLAREAEHFHGQMHDRDADPAHTEADYQPLKRAYEAAAQAFAHIHATDAVRDAMAKVTRTMNRLVYYYEAAPIRRMRWSEVQRMADAIEASAERIYARAKYEYRELGSPNSRDDRKRTLEHIENLRAAARRYHQQVSSCGTDPAESVYEFTRVSDHARRAASRAWVFSSRVRNDLTELQSLLDRLSEYYEECHSSIRRF
ncbi:hypothetical protein HYR69_08340 [Candidatus Sumerlaeota bacterium]|nr:hypothetical protein [Candidatus Sumerlaeota bacterium]MBI3737277.1 hypothetical protein [Candidatus Sumerlaeota bacterium]